MNTTPSPVVINQLFNNSVKKLIEGHSQEDIFNYLVSYNSPPSKAKAMVAKASMMIEAMPKANPRADGIKSLIKGIVWLILSLVIFGFVKSMGSMVYLPSGMALYGVARILSGLWKVIFAKDLVSD